MSGATPLDRLYIHVSPVGAGARVWPRLCSCGGQDRGSGWACLHEHIALWFLGVSRIRAGVDLQFNLRAWWNFAHVWSSIFQARAPRILFMQFVRARTDTFYLKYIHTLPARDCVFLLRCFLYKQLSAIWTICGQWAVVELLHWQQCPCTLCTHSHIINIHTDSTDSQPAATIPRVGVAKALGGQGEQGVSVVLFLHPNALNLSHWPDINSSVETSSEPRSVCYSRFPVEAAALGNVTARCARSLTANNAWQSRGDSGASAQRHRRSGGSAEVLPVCYKKDYGHTASKHPGGRRRR